MAAAWLWVAINATMIFTLVIPHHRSRMPGQAKAWVMQDTLLPAFIAIGISCVGYILILAATPPLSVVSTLAIAFIFAAISTVGAAWGAALIQPQVREIFGWIKRRRFG
jgi:hypothetical protein